MAMKWCLSGSHQNPTLVKEETPVRLTIFRTQELRPGLGERLVATNPQAIPQMAKEAITHLQYTSRSTSSPKKVKVQPNPKSNH